MYPIVFALFVASGFASLVYQIVWLRMAFAHFGIVTPVLSVVISTFMLGLGLGSVAAGRWGGRLASALNVSPAVTYAAAELLIGVGALVVPAAFDCGAARLLELDSPSSVFYLLASATIIVASLLPWCIFMGATFPLMIGFIRAIRPNEGRSFSYLYLGNVAGAVTGALASAGFMIELFGFRHTSWIAASCNVAIAVTSVAIGWRARVAGAAIALPPLAAMPRSDGRFIEWVLFTTGFCALAMEVVWARGFTIVLATTIYAFAAILATYLLSTCVGTYIYRRRAASGAMPNNAAILFWAAVTAACPAVFDDPRIQMTGLGVLLSIVPFCAVLGFLTPKVIDDYAGGDERQVGRAYAINIAGGTLGPLFAGYCLVTLFDIRICMVLLALPVAVLAGWGWIRSGGPAGAVALRVALPLLPLLIGGFASRSYEANVSRHAPREVHRDYVATAIAFGQGLNKHLLVNGIGITILTPITKVIAHLPLALQGHPQKGLVICFGMGTTFRSMASWGIDTTVVDLTGSVIKSFGYFHADAAAVLANPKAHVIVDDGRRFLERTDQSFDVIVIDPPPPVEAAGSSLLYSREFYQAAKHRLNAGGILQQWIPISDKAILDAVVRTVKLEFPYVEVFRSIKDWGYHIVASMQPIAELTPETFAARLPPKAQVDLLEWERKDSVADMAEAILSRHVATESVMPLGNDGPIITDDRPYNEYFLVRALKSSRQKG